MIGIFSAPVDKFLDLCLTKARATWPKRRQPKNCLLVPRRCLSLRKKGHYTMRCNRTSTNYLYKVQSPYETTNGLTVKPTLNPRHRNADLPSFQQWHPSERRPLLPSTALFRGFHLSSAGLEKADGEKADVEWFGLAG